MKLQTMPLRFRAWDTIEKRFLKNDELLDFSRGFINFYDEEMIMSGGRDFIISQDTGLKDANGISVSFGDIIRDIDNGYLSVAKYVDGECVGVDPKSNKTIDSLYLIARDGEVIGNIWQTAELLENNDGKR